MNEAVAERTLVCAYTNQEGIFISRNDATF